MILNVDNFTEIIDWDDFKTDQSSYSDGKYNFLITSEYVIDNYCSLIERNCPQNQTQCQAELDNYLSVDLGSDQSNLIYESSQYSAWSSAQQFKWEQLTDEQKKKIILVNFSASISKSFLANLFLVEIEVFAFYIAFETDGIFLQNEFNMRLNQIDLINNSDFGGPFNCTKNDQGEYSSYKYSDPSQFNGFQYMDQDGESCGGQCSCEYFNVKRLFPIDWRCRPWFRSSFKEYEITFSEPYSDLSTNASDTTITYKITDNINEMNITQEKEMAPIAVQSIDLDLKQIKQRLSSNNNFELEYSYIVSPKTFDYDDNQGYYQLLAMIHPLNNGTVQNIIDIEFQNSTNKQEEINQYLKQVDFMLNTKIRESGCNLIAQNQDMFEIIIRNGQEYLTYFSTLKVCYGNLYTQENLIVGYLAKAISTEVIQTQANIVTQAFKPMQNAIIIAYIICLIFSAILLSLLLGLLLQYNFDNPINILISLLNKAKPNEINQFSEMISLGKIKTQQELKNLIFAINSVITFVDCQILSLLRDQKQIQDDDLIQIYLKALQNFEILENITGIGICQNNISNIYRAQKNQQMSIEFMQKANLNMDQQIDEQEWLFDIRDAKQMQKSNNLLQIIFIFQRTPTL
ncbi:transmembrane protein, putative (macronuclear) [Tetrahymena thermophila SB210]|uniref:Transmembrane protein, putative n=1 Tax=Tetrahymena thermophila (strain SB210) TaxID=312017 RepID=W7X9E6_TETTS|nr:transmembrane protein, putative [Tetrahymena thermophila SB210]EWS73013.1 transmembrane protein, putative [Tetrahymena thermophila SB210]|eukprot:XP_012654410.1 transmembrane protein, putative [Tetrahymena thermophila SB210]